jgi:hypothetical protein
MRGLFCIGGVMLVYHWLLRDFILMPNYFSERFPTWWPIDDMKYRYTYFWVRDTQNDIITIWLDI